MPIKSFRGNLADDGIQTVPLSTNDGSTGYRIKKLEGIPGLPGNDNFESVIQVWSVPQTAASNAIDFSDQTLLGMIFYSSFNAGGANTDVVVFDNMTFNQDIYITHKDNATGVDVNYYIELEQIRLDLTENTVATLKDIRNIEASSV